VAPAHRAQTGVDTDHTCVLHERLPVRREPKVRFLIPSRHPKPAASANMPSVTIHAPSQTRQLYPCRPFHLLLVALDVQSRAASTARFPPPEIRLLRNRHRVCLRPTPEMETLFRSATAFRPSCRCAHTS
jgi:hypothetical protein